MSSSELGKIISEGLVGSKARGRLLSICRSPADEEYTFEDLLDEVGDEAEPGMLAFVLGRLAEIGQVRAIYRLVSRRRHGGIKDFKSLSEIDFDEPYHDWRTDSEFVPGIDDVMVIYSFCRQ